MESAQRWFEDFKIGEHFETPAKTLTDAHVLFFAGLSGDAHPIHYDEEHAKQTHFGKRVIHGLLLTALTAAGASSLATLTAHSIVAFVEQRTRFLAPVFVGDTLSPRHEVRELERKQSAGLLVLGVTLTNQRGEKVLEGEQTYLVAFRPASKA
jgi:acyl dehydratase